MCVLFVEDEVLIAMLATEALQDAGHETLMAHTADEAFNYITTMPNRFSCLVTDLHMPGSMTGIDLVEHARTQYSDLPMLMTTALANLVSPSWLTQRRVIMMSKPYRLSELVETVHIIINTGSSSRYRST